MQYETVSGAVVPKIGFGTWKIGGDSSPNPSLEARSLAAVRSALELGYTHLDTAEHYAAGHAEELLGRAIRESAIAREKLFITSKVWPNHLRYDDVLRSCAGSLRRLGTEYLDLYLIHWPNQLIPLRDTFRALNQLVREGRVRHIGVSNFTLRLLKQARNLAESSIFTDQVPYSLFDRTYSKNGVLAYCQENDILLTAYSPLEGGRLRANQLLESIASAHAATTYQVALAWLVVQPRVIAIPMSFEPGHQAENLASGELELSSPEIEHLNRL
jgi:diketogulonate reductase-like aldo/keto reductase